MKKKIIIFPLLLLVKINVFGQKTINFGSYSSTVMLVDSSKFNLFGTWKVIHREYEVELPHTYESVLLTSNVKDDILDLYIRRRQQGELIYGSYVYFSKNLFEPYCPYISSIMINPIYKKAIRKIKAGNYDLFHHMNLDGQNLLYIDLWCSQQSYDTSEETVLVLNENLILIFGDNVSTFLERVKNITGERPKWQKDEYGFNTVIMRGSSDFQFLLENIQTNRDKSLFFILNRPKRGEEKFLYISKFSKADTPCNLHWKKEYILSLSDSLKKLVSYPLNSAAANNIIISIGGITNNKTKEWSIKWKVIDQESVIKTVKLPKSFIYELPNKKTDLYLIKHDDVEVLEEKNDWLKIRYYGKKTIEGWIKKSDVEAN